MAKIPVTAIPTTLGGRIDLQGANEFSVEIHNDGPAPLTGLEVKLYVNASSRGTTWFDTPTQFTMPADKGIIRGVLDGADPTTLAPGASTGFFIVEVGSFHSVEILATATADTELDIYIGKDKDNGR